MFWLFLAVLEKNHNGLESLIRLKSSFNREDRLIRDARIKKSIRNLVSVNAKSIYFTVCLYTLFRIGIRNSIDKCIFWQVVCRMHERAKLLEGQCNSGKTRVIYISYIYRKFWNILDIPFIKTLCCQKR